MWLVQPKNDIMQLNVKTVQDFLSTNPRLFPYRMKATWPGQGVIIVVAAHCGGNNDTETTHQHAWPSWTVHVGLIPTL